MGMAAQHSLTQTIITIRKSRNIVVRLVGRQKVYKTGNNRFLFSILSGCEKKIMGWLMTNYADVDVMKGKKKKVIFYIMAQWFDIKIESFD